jgi:hypothetical protein
LAELEMLTSFHSAAVAALVDAEAVPAGPALVGEVQTFVCDQLRRLPLHVRAGVQLIAVILTLRSAARGPFWRQDSKVRLRALRRWESSSLGPVSQYVRLIRSLVLLRAHEEPDVLTA